VSAPRRVQGPVHEEGEFNGAAFRIDIPENWNGGLVMYAHGYTPVSREPEFNEMMVKVANDQGLAIAQSKYSRQGWAAREGTLETESLRRYFVRHYGRTSPTIIAGHSQGAAITYKTIERYREAYDGALPMCGTAEPSLDFMKVRIFDMRLLFDYFFPGLPGSVVDFPDGEATMSKTFMKAQAMINEKPEEAAVFARLVELPGPDSIPGVIAFWSEILRELQIRTGGNAFNNLDTIYIGSEDDATLNREIPRYASDPESVRYLGAWVTNTGRIDDPVLSMHTLVDQLIPADRPDTYKQLTQIMGTDEFYSQVYVDRVGHCNFTEEETAEALRLLLHWIESGERPAKIEVTEER
jgi:pimeloyl-ACP methyl ester carboxylesterase